MEWIIWNLTWTLITFTFSVFVWSIDHFETWGSWFMVSLCVLQVFLLLVQVAAYCAT